MHHHKMTRELRERRRKSSTVASFLPFEQFSVYNVMKCPRVYHAPASLNDQPQCSKRCPSSSASKNDRKGAIDQSKTVSDGTRTRNLPLRRRMPYPLGHGDASRQTHRNHNKIVITPLIATATRKYHSGSHSHVSFGPETSCIADVASL